MKAKDYLNQITSGHRDKPRFMAWMALLLGLWADYAACALSIAGAFNKDRARGGQLDLIGALVGVSRSLAFSPENGARNLDDGDYLKLINAAIAQNGWDGTNESLPGIIGAAYPHMGVVLRDNMDMSINAMVRGEFTDLQLELLNADLLIPRPAGVRMTYEVPVTTDETTVRLQGGLHATQTMREGLNHGKGY